MTMSRFAILIHNHPFLHWDLLFEHGDTCRTWRLLQAPDSQATEFPAEELPDHRQIYLDYEGPVGEGRGTVVRWDSGTFVGDVGGKDEFDMTLAGQRWQGDFRLERVDGLAWIVRRQPKSS